MEKQHKEKEREHDSEMSDVMVLEGHTSEVLYDFSIGVIFCYLSDVLTLQFSFVSILLLGFCLCLESRKVTTCIWVSISSISFFFSLVYGSTNVHIHVDYS